MTDLKDLPAEVLDLTFITLQDDEAIKTVGLCILVCKQWKLPAQRVFYSTITLQTQEQADDLIDALRWNKSSPGVFTHTLIYEVPKYARLVPHTDNIQFFMDLFSALQFFDWENPRCEYYVMVAQAALVSKWTKLKKITYPEDGHQLDLYINCAVPARNSIASLDLGYYNDNDASDQHTRLSNRLDLFHLLREIVTLGDSATFIERMENYTTNCQSLKSVTYRTAVRETLGMPTNIDFSLIKPQPERKKLEKTSLVFSNDNSLLYFMTKYPQLKSFEVNEGYVAVRSEKELYPAMVSTQHEFSAAVVGKFLAYLQNIPSYEFYHLYSIASISDIMQNFWNHSTTKPSIKCLSLVYGDSYDFKPYPGGSDQTFETSMTSDNTYFDHGLNLCFTTPLVINYIIWKYFKKLEISWID